MRQHRYMHIEGMPELTSPLIDAGPAQPSTHGGLTNAHLKLRPDLHHLDRRDLLILVSCSPAAWSVQRVVAPMPPDMIHVTRLLQPPNVELLGDIKSSCGLEGRGSAMRRTPGAAGYLEHFQNESL